LMSFNKALHKGGVLVFDSFNTKIIDPSTRSTWQDEVYEFPDMVIKRRHRNLNWSENKHHWSVEWRYEITMNGETQEIDDHSRLRAFEPGYIVSKLDENGFKYLETLEESRLRILALKR